METEQKLLLFNVLGSFSVISLVLAARYVLPAVLAGDLAPFQQFFQTYPGSQPFVIFIVPIIVVIGPVWVWRTWRSLRAPR